MIGIRPLRHTGEGRYLDQTWVPAFAGTTKSVCGIVR
jgi:hypothetical protein